MSNLELEGKIALVTGGSRGIGRATCLALAREGASVVVNYARDADAAEEVVAQIGAAGGTALSCRADVADSGQAFALIDQAYERFGGLHILVNNAGITKDGLVLRMGQEDWQAVIQTNLTGSFNCIQAAAKKMIKQKEGVIINLSSVVGLTGNAGQANYSAAKAGLIGLTKTVARELAPRNIRVNAIAPGFIATEMTASLSDELKAETAARIPLARFGGPEEVAEAIAWLASDKAAYITGQVLVIDGGLAM